MSASSGGSASDDELIQRIRSGERDALDTLLRRYHDRVHLLCLRMCRNRQDADDATQDALIAVARGLPRFDGRSALSTWIYRVATNSCLDELRRRKRRPDPVDDDGWDHVPAPTEDPADAVVRSGIRTRIRSALDELPDEFRAPLVLRDVMDLDYATIAEVLDVPAGTVRSRIARARARMAELLPDLGNPEDDTDVEPLQRHRLS